MKKVNKKILVIVVICMLLIAAILVGYFIMRKRQTNNVTIGSINDATGENVVTEETTLHYGSRGDEVKRLQTYLNQQLKMLIWKELPTYNGKEIKELVVDGIFGARTQAVVKWHFNSLSVKTNQF